MSVKNLEAFREIKYNDKKNGETNYDFDKIVEVSKKEPNYYDEQTNRNVRYYDRIILISEKKTNEIPISIIVTQSTLKKWFEIQLRKL